MKEAEFLTPREVADRLRISEQTVRRLLCSGELPGGVRAGKKIWRVRAAALKAYIEGGGGMIAKGKKSAKTGH
jgi:excisionase family DNA binding protein